jgi:ribose transport system ATP-binding protein
MIIGDLSLAEKQLVEIAKALSKNPDIIVFDEATSALGQSEVDFLFDLIRKLTKEEHKTAIFISHKMNELEAIADYATVFRDAKNVATFKMGTVNNEQITKWIVGRDLDKTYPRRKTPLSNEIVLSLKNVSVAGKLKNITTNVRKGEILGIAGLHGHGQSEFLRVLFGAAPLHEGSISVKGRDARIKKPRDAIGEGIAFMPEDRKTEGLHVALSVKENLSIMTLDKKSRMCWMISTLEKEANKNIISQLNIKISSPEQLAVNLSGGNQQKVVIGKVLATESDILLMGDPTRGIDVGTKAEMYQLMRNLSEEGRTILLYSTEINELIGLCDRVLVLKNGSIAALLEGEEITKASIVNASLGIGKGDTNVRVV